MNAAQSEVRDGMRLEFDIAIEADDGAILRADVFRPLTGGTCPVILSYGPYAKGMSFPDSRPYAWKHLVDRYPEVTNGSSHLESKFATLYERALSRMQGLEAGAERA